MIITYDSTRAVTVTRKNNAAYYIKMYDLETLEQTFEELFGSEEKEATANHYIKMKNVE